MAEKWLERQQKLDYFHELLTCGHNIYSWIYDHRLAPVYNNCPFSMVYDIFFAMEEKRIPTINQVHKKSQPIVVTNPIGLIWIADFENDENGELRYIHTIGPVFFDDVSQNAVEKELNRLKLSNPIRQEFRNVLRSLPVIPATRFLQYGIMLHYTLTGEKITTSEFQYLGKVDSDGKKTEEQKVKAKHGTWLAEQAILKMVEEGNLDYRKQKDQFSASGRVGKMSLGDDVIRQIKNQIIVFTALCTRAAIRGGLPPETAYTLSDMYIQNAEASTSVAELAEVSRAMEDDFVHRVHQVRSQSGISPQIQKCCDYIRFHLDEKITVSQLARLVGHADNYLIRKFKEETGKSISQYIAAAKMEKAKELLQDSNETVQEISSQLGFATQSHFGEVFKKHTGMTPAQWRGR